MDVSLSKTNYILYRDCPKNSWLKTHRPDIYFQYELSAFERLIIETGNEVELAARNLFPKGILIEGTDKKAQISTQSYIDNKDTILFQPVFVKNGFLAAIDVLEYNPSTQKYIIYEIKATSDIDVKVHYHDLAFQVNLLNECGLMIEKANLIHLNAEYVRSGLINPSLLFTVEDVTEEIKSLSEEVAIEMQVALKYLSHDSEPAGCCSCIYKGRSKHCTTFTYSNPEIPIYSVHDIARIGNSKAKLTEFIDNQIFHIHDIPTHIKLTDIQQNQVDTHTLDKILIQKDRIAEELTNLTFPLYFIDYETFPSAIPRYDGYSPYQQIPFQYSLYVLESITSEPTHFEFLHTDSDDPSRHFTTSLQQHIGTTGSILVWNKTFECGRNSELARLVPEAELFMLSLNERIYDLMDVFKKQYYVHKDFRGSTSIKKVLPVLDPNLTYKELSIQDGGSAAEIWNKLSLKDLSQIEKDKIVKDLKIYCGLDAYAMYSIWRELYKIAFQSADIDI